MPPQTEETAEPHGTAIGPLVAVALDELEEMLYDPDPWVRLAAIHETFDRLIADVAD
jgi:hypothetical protein